MGHTASGLFCLQERGEAELRTLAAPPCNEDWVPGWLHNPSTTLHYTLRSQDQAPGLAVAGAQHLHPLPPRPVGLRGAQHPSE